MNGYRKCRSFTQQSIIHLFKENKITTFAGKWSDLKEHDAE